LLAEDEQALRLPLAATLRKKGFFVYEAVNGEEALQVLRDPNAEIDLLVSDIVMPRIGGPELAVKAREIRPSLKVLFLSGYADDSLQEYHVDSVATWFLGKPFSTRDLLDKIGEVFYADPTPKAKSS
jgi:CheY-like chemotaxis protein